MTIELDPAKVSPQTHVFVGMFRPPWEEVRRKHIYETHQYGCANYHDRDPSPDMISDERNPRSYELNVWCELKKTWLAGHFDIPQWRRVYWDNGHPVADQIRTPG